jgi:hypothetical protein
MNKDVKLLAERYYRNENNKGDTNTSLINFEFKDRVGNVETYFAKYLRIEKSGQERVVTNKIEISIVEDIKEEFVASFN